jgi:hypothetical protein
MAKKDKNFVCFFKTLTSSAFSSAQINPSKTLKWWSKSSAESPTILRPWAPLLFALSSSVDVFCQDVKRLAILHTCWSWHRASVPLFVVASTREVDLKHALLRLQKKELASVECCCCCFIRLGLRGVESSGRSRWTSRCKACAQKQVGCCCLRWRCSNVRFCLSSLSWASFDSTWPFLCAALGNRKFIV